jgi:hypothetical protein
VMDTLRLFSGVLPSSVCFPYPMLMESWLMVTWINIKVFTVSVSCSLPRDLVSLTQAMTSVQSSSHTFPVCRRIQSRTAKKEPETETRHQVTTDISGPLSSSGLLYQVEISIWSESGIGRIEATNVPGASLGFQRRSSADLGQGSSLCPAQCGYTHRFRRIRPYPSP